MNVICNSCVGGFIYKFSNIQFNNPFIWNLITAENFAILLNNIDNINLLNITDINDNAGIYKSSICVDNQVTIYFPHYINDSSKKTPMVIGTSVYYNDIKKYIYDEFIKRSKRYILNTTKPVFIFDNAIHVGVKTTEEELQHLFKIKHHKYTVLFLTPNDNIINKYANSTDIIFIKRPIECTKAEDKAKYIIDYCKTHNIKL